jgi:mono/diheme cytochrome c family protein
MTRLITTVAFALMAIGASSQVKKKVSAGKTSRNSAFQQTMLRGKAVFDKTCITCHQKDGGGVMNLNPPLIQTTYVLGDKSKLINIVLKGLNKEIEIEGDTYTNPMPAQANLTDQQVADVLTFIRNSFKNKASVITPAEVSAVRKRK